MGIEPVSQSATVKGPEARVLTHRNRNTEQSTNDLVHVGIDIVVTRLSAVHCPVGILAHAQTKQIRLRYDEVEVFVKDGSDMVCCIRLRCLCSELFQERPRY